MKIQTLENVILRYLNHLNNSSWIIDEAYKFEFANYLQSNLKFDQQSDQEILDLLIKSQSIKYDLSRGVQFIQKSGKETLSEFINYNDITLFRKFQSKSFEDINWANRTMSYTALSAWLTSVFPEKIYPVPIKGFNETINYLFDTDLKNFPKIGDKYIIECQKYLKQTENELKKYPVVDIHLKVWNEFYIKNPQLNISVKNKFEQVDWNWLTQDFHLFIHRNILKLYKPKSIPITKTTLKQETVEDELTSIEGQSKLAIHLRYERNSTFIKKIKENAIKSNPMLNCEVCGFSFFETYGELGKGFIEAHHINPLNETKQTKTKREDITLVCSNCHRMLHRGISTITENTILTMDELKNLLN